MALSWPWLLRLALRQRPAVIFTTTCRYAPVIRRIKRRGEVVPFVFVDVMGLGSIDLDTRGSPRPCGSPDSPAPRGHVAAGR